MGLVVGVLPIPRIAVQLGFVLAKRPAPGAAGAGGIFPLGLGGQAIAVMFAIGFGLVPADTNHWLIVVVQVVWLELSVLQMGDLGLSQFKRREADPMLRRLVFVTVFFAVRRTHQEAARAQADKFHPIGIGIRLSLAVSQQPGLFRVACDDRRLGPDLGDAAFTGEIQGIGEALPVGGLEPECMREVWL